MFELVTALVGGSTCCFCGCLTAYSTWSLFREAVAHRSYDPKMSAWCMGSSLAIFCCSLLFAVVGYATFIAVCVILGILR